MDGRYLVVFLCLKYNRKEMSATAISSLSHQWRPIVPLPQRLSLYPARCALCRVVSPVLHAGQMREQHIQPPYRKFLNIVNKIRSYLYSIHPLVHACHNVPSRSHPRLGAVYDCDVGQLSLGRRASASHGCGTSSGWHSYGIPSDCKPGAHI